MTDQANAEGLEPAIAPPTETKEAVQDSPVEVAQQSGSAPEKNETDDSLGFTEKAQRRFDKLTREKYDERRRADALEWELKRLREAQAPKDQVAPDTTKAPTLEQFGYDETAYRDAVEKHAASVARQAALDALKAEREQEARQSKAKAFEDREAKFAEKTADYRETVYDDTVPISETMADVIRESEMGPELAYFLGKNRDTAALISQMSPIQAARELGRIEAKLVAPAPKPAPVVSQAPPPPPKLAATEPSIEKDPKDMSDAEFAKWRKRQIAQRRVT